MLAPSYLPFAIAQELQPTITIRQKPLKTTDELMRSIAKLSVFVRDQEILEKREERSFG
jgi:hypothetical protein